MSERWKGLPSARDLVGKKVRITREITYWSGGRWRHVYPESHLLVKATGSGYFTLWDGFGHGLRVTRVSPNDFELATTKEPPMSNAENEGGRGAVDIGRYIGRLRVVRWLWWRVWRRRLGFFTDEWPPREVVRVKGWRTAIVDYRGGSRRTVTPLFWFDR